MRTVILIFFTLNSALLPHIRPLPAEPQTESPAVSPAQFPVDTDPRFGTRTIEFSGFQWQIKSASYKMGPGPNYFSHSPNSVRIDDKGRLHMKIRRQGGRWLCSEVVNIHQFGYGWHIFRLASPLQDYDRNTVIGLFTWDDSIPPYHNEIDIEFARWGMEIPENGQFVVQPAGIPENMHRFTAAVSGHEPLTTHIIQWEKNRIRFASFSGSISAEAIRQLMPPDYLEDDQTSPGFTSAAPVAHQSAAHLPGDHHPAAPDNKITGDLRDKLIASWDYAASGLVPRKSTKIRINFWLLEGTPPADGQEQELIVDSYEFFPGR